jgi:hypothetical protein
MILILLCSAMIAAMLIATAVALHNEATNPVKVRRTQF